MLFYTFDRLKLYLFIRMLHSEQIVVLNHAVRLAHEIKRLSAQLGDHFVDEVFSCKVAKDVNLRFKVLSFVLLESSS